MAVESILKSLKIDYLVIELGKVELIGEINSEQHKRLNAALKDYGLEVLENSKQLLVERIKVLIVDLIHSSNRDDGVKFSEYLSKSLFCNYTYLANTFSELEGSTIERFFITTRVERVKELLVYESKLSIKEIALELEYSSEAHLCQQFKKVTGLTPSVFKKMCESDKLICKS